MGRWEPDTRARLERAALDLYDERGFEQTTVAEIAARAGLTERTFFRYFGDKREVLFGGSPLLKNAMLQSIADAPASATPLAAIGAALKAGAGLLQPRYDLARRRQRILEANSNLQERELMKLAAFSAAMATALQERGVPALRAELMAETGIALFRITFKHWVELPQEQQFIELIELSLIDLQRAFGD